MKERRDPLTNIRSHLPSWPHLQSDPSSCLQILAPKKHLRIFLLGGQSHKVLLEGIFCSAVQTNVISSFPPLFVILESFSFPEKTPRISSSKWNHFKTWPRIWARTEMHITGFGGKAKKWQKLPIFANSLQFSSTGQCTNTPGSVRGTIPAHTNTPCSHQRMDKQGLFSSCNKPGIGKLSTGLRKADKRTGNKAPPSCRK